MAHYLHTVGKTSTAIYALCVNLTTNYTFYTEQQFKQYKPQYTIVRKSSITIYAIYVNSNNNYTLCVKAPQNFTQNVKIQTLSTCFL